MHAAARAKTPGTRRSKAAADPWQALPRLADLFDSQTPQPFFKGSKVSALEELTLTETKLLEQTASILGISLAQLVKAGTLVYAKAAKILASATPATPEPERKRADSESPPSAAEYLFVIQKLALSIHGRRQSAHPHYPGQARHQSRHRIPDRLALAQDPSPRIIAVQARRGLRCSRGRSSSRSRRRP